MDALIANVPFLLFILVGTVCIAAAILVIASRNPVHSALFLLLTFLCVAVLFVMKSAEFVAAVQVLVYAGGIMVLFLFVVMLINVRALPAERLGARMWQAGIVTGLALFAVLFVMIQNGGMADRVDDPLAFKRVVPLSAAAAGAEPEIAGNAEAVGMLLYRQYLVPFEVASIFLLVAMIGAIVIGKREITHLEEETAPDFIIDRVKSEHKVKEAMSA